MSASARIRLTWLDYPDPVIGERVVRTPDFVLRHVAVDAVFCGHLASRRVRRRFSKDSRRRGRGEGHMTRGAFRIVRLRLATHLAMRIVARQATDPRIS